MAICAADTVCKSLLGEGDLSAAVICPNENGCVELTDLPSVKTFARFTHGASKPGKIAAELAGELRHDE